MDRHARADADWLRFPVLGISAEDAEAYVAWLNASGRLTGARPSSNHLKLDWIRGKVAATSRRPGTEGDVDE